MYYSKRAMLFQVFVPKNCKQTVIEGKDSAEIELTGKSSSNRHISVKLLSYAVAKLNYPHQEPADLFRRILP